MVVSTISSIIEAVENIWEINSVISSSAITIAKLPAVLDVDLVVAITCEELMSICECAIICWVNFWNTNNIIVSLKFFLKSTVFAVLS